MSEILSWYVQRTFWYTRIENASRLDFFAACSNSTAAVTRNDYMKKGTVNSPYMQHYNSRQYQQSKAELLHSSLKK